MPGAGDEQGIGGLADRLEAERFVGRREVIDPVLAAVAGTTPVRVFHLHGSGGVGKSATLRAIAREAAAAGATVRRLDGRLIGGGPDDLRSALLDPPSVDLICLDEVGELQSLRFELRRLIREELAAATVVVFAGRAAPDPLWFEDGLDRVSKALVLRPLDARQSREALQRAGVRDQADLDAAVAWSHGYPLALALAADLEGGDFDHARVGASVPVDERLDDLLLDRLGSDELAGVDPDVLDVAAVAAVVDARLLAAVLPGRPTKAGLAALRACRLSEPIGARTTLHRLARQALRTRLRESDPDRYRTLVLRVADHLRARAMVDPGRHLTELAALVENEQVRLSFDPSTTHYADRVRPGDLEALAAATGRADEAWFGRLARWMRQQPDGVVVIRSVAGTVSAVGIVYTAASVPAWATSDLEVGVVLDHARRLGREDEAMFLQDVTIAEDPIEPAAAAEIVRVGNAAALVRSGMPAPRYVYVTSRRTEIAPLEVLGYVELPELRRSDDDRDLATIVCDFGPAGIAGRAHELIAIEQQEPLPDELAAGAQLIAAVRCFHDDDALAAAMDASPDEARVRVTEALDRAFTSSSDDRALRQAIERTYLDPEGGHVVAQRELYMSRSSFYRHLQAARLRLAERGPAPAGAASRRPTLRSAAHGDQASPIA